MDKILRMKDLINKLNDASNKYYNFGNSPLTDSEFDALLSELASLEHDTEIVFSNSPTHNVGTSTILSNLPEVVHNHPMLSLEKCHSVEEVKSFSGNNELIAMAKMDGLTISLMYQDGELIQAETRGDGKKGNIVTSHVKQFTNVPLHIKKTGTYIIDGEAIIDDETFSQININGEFKNSRNLAAGTLSLLDMSIVRQRQMKFVAWDVIQGGTYNTMIENLGEALQLGFIIVPHVLLSPYAYISTNDIITTAIDSIVNAANESYHYPIDGIVFKFNDIIYGKSLGKTEHHFKNGIAFKMADELYETTLRDIVWQTSKTGLINPVAVFDQVDMDGALTTRATLHNISYIEGLELGYGDTIQVRRANMVIPKVHDNLTRSNTWILPEHCPCCGGEVEIRKDYNSSVLVCLNPDCEAKIFNKLVHYVSRNAMDIEDFSEKTIEKFMDLRWLESLNDIYTLYAYKDKMITLSGFGKKSTEKLLAAIEKSKTAKFEKFLYALSIPLIGKTASRDISDFLWSEARKSSEFTNTYGGDIFNLFSEKIANEEKSYWTLHVKNFGNKMADSLYNYFSEQMVAVKALANYITFINELEEENGNLILSGKTFVITGSLTHYQNRDELIKVIEKNGGVVGSKISNSTTYLINNDINSTSSKNKKAKELNIPIITENEFLTMIGIS